MKWITTLPGKPLPGEFELIRRYFAPLARKVPGALNLVDDACTFVPNPGQDLVLTADAIIAGVHFLSTDPPDRIARKLLRVNLSDLSAKGSRPLGYLMTMALDTTVDEEWITAFVAGLAADQEEFGIALYGGDTVLTPGPISLSLTAIGEVPAGNALRRIGANPGDHILVTGAIGDGYLGLRVLRGDFPDMAGHDRQALIDRYQLPQPRVALGVALGQQPLASAGMDISDGLLGDLAHLCEVSGCGAVISADRVPVSGAAIDVLATDPSLMNELITAGDDYELLLAVPPRAVEAVLTLASLHGPGATDIGEFVADTGIRVEDRDGKPLDIPVRGFTHF